MSIANSVSQTTDGGYVILGTAYDSTGIMQSDMYLVKTGADGIISVPENENVQSVSIYPNPFSDHTNIQFTNSGQESHTIILMNIQGQIVREYENIRNTSAKIYRNDLPNGMYFFQLISGKQIKGQGKLIIE
jgi:hypothetical protein